MLLPFAMTEAINRKKKFLVTPSTSVESPEPGNEALSRLWRRFRLVFRTRHNVFVVGHCRVARCLVCLAPAESPFTFLSADTTSPG